MRQLIRVGIFAPLPDVGKARQGKDSPLEKPESGVILLT
jgi:hypothetical protein